MRGTVRGARCIGRTTTPILLGCVPPTRATAQRATTCTAAATAAAGWLVSATHNASSVAAYADPDTTRSAGTLG